MRRLKQKARRFLAMLLSVILLWGAAPGYTSAAARFADVAAGSWCYAAVMDLADRGIMTGKSSTRFAPNDTITRAEFVAVLARCFLTEQELAVYNYKGKFHDVPANHWANRYINWASQSKVVNGVGGNRFDPSGKITRQDMAVMLANFTKAAGAELPLVNSPQLFLDYRSISDYAYASVTACQRAGIFQGYSDLTFRPKRSSLRSEAAQVVSGFLKIYTAPDYQTVHGQINGHNVDAVVFDPSRFTTGVVMGNNKVRGAEKVSSIVSRTGAKIAVNAAFFDMGGSYTPYGTIVNDGQIVTTFNNYSPAKSAITMDSKGRFSVENFTTKITLSAQGSDGKVQEISGVGVNVLPGANDPTREIFTKDWGADLGFTATRAAVVDASGIITAVYHNQNVSIPQTGYVLAQRADRKYENFWDSVAKGNTMKMQVDYVGSRTQDIKLTIGVGPKIVSGGKAYGNSSTYQAEGLLGISNFSDTERVAIGVKKDGRLVILYANTSLPELSKIMVAMGCESAVNLDGGGSANLYVNGQWLIGPQTRLLNNMLYFK